MPGRFGRPGLLGTMARTAVISGTATAVNRGVRRRMGAEQAQAGSYAPQQMPPQQQYPAQPASGEDPGDDVVAQLERLGRLHQSGVLSDNEFAAAKSKLLS